MNSPVDGAVLLLPRNLMYLKWTAPGPRGSIFQISEIFIGAQKNERSVPPLDHLSATSAQLFSGIRSDWSRPHFSSENSRSPERSTLNRPKYSPSSSFHSFNHSPCSPSSAAKPSPSGVRRLCKVSSVWIL